MASSENANLQKFISKDGTPLASLRSHSCIGDTKERYILWSDILCTFHGINRLESHRGMPVLFTIDSDGELSQPLRIQCNPYSTYVVAYGSDQRQQSSAESCNTQQGSDEHRQGESQNLAPHEILPSLKDLFETCKELCQGVENAANGSRDIFRPVAANARYYLSKFREGIERLDKSGANTLVNGKSQEQLLEELGDVEQQVLEGEYRNICRSTLCHRTGTWNYAASSMFLALPSDLDSWDDSNPSTHQFRFYFLCDNWKQNGALEDMPQHVHLSNHPGYLLQRPQEFFQKYGDYVLRMLLMAKRGYLNSNYEIPPLDTLQILWGCDPDVIGSHINKDTFGLLIDKTINYLQELSPPKWTTKLALNRDQSAAIRTFLEVQGDHNSEGNLYRYIDSSRSVFWICQSHACQHFDNELLKGLREFVQSHGGRVDMQQARLEVELGSTNEAEQFGSLLRDCGLRLDISVKLTWNATRPCVKELCMEIASAGRGVLKLDGITLDIDSQGYERSLHSVCNIGA
ncbi:hypothetical protein BG006_009483, partial [Podila minutissima]